MVLQVTPMFLGRARPIEFISAAINNASSTTTNTVTAPTGIAAGDLLVMVGVSDDGVTISTAPSGWTSHVNEAGPRSAQFYTKIATGSEPAYYSWVWSGHCNSTAAILCYRNASSVDVIGARTRQDSNSVGAGISATRKGALIGCYGIGPSLSVTVTPPAGMAQRSIHSAASSPRLAVYDLLPSLVGASGDKTLGWARNSAAVGWLVQIY